MHAQSFRGALAAQGQTHARLQPQTSRRLANRASSSADRLPHESQSEAAKAPGAPAAAVVVAAGSGRERQRAVPFDERYRQLEAFSQQHGHTRVPINEPSGLGAWAAQQRHAWQAGRLQPERQQRLAALCFCIDAFQDAWASRFRQLAAFHSQHGHCRLPRAPSAQRQHPGLYSWMHHQLHLWKQGTLADDRRRRLEGLGIDFEPQDAAWEARFAELLQFRREAGHANVPTQWPPNQGLANWVVVQRRRWRGVQGAALTATQQSRLLGCGFRLSPLQDEWDRRYAQLCELKVQHGSSSVLNGPLPAGDGLAAWADFQRRQWRGGRLAPDRIARLEALGFARQTPRQRWQQRLAALDQLVSVLGYPAVYSLLVLAPPSSSPPDAAAAAVEAALAAAAAATADSSSSAGSKPQRTGQRAEGEPAGHGQRLEAPGEEADAGGAGSGVAPSSRQLSPEGGPVLTGEQAAEVVRWHRKLRLGRKLPPGLAVALAARVLQPAQ